jgi:hypothetical protein
MARSKGTKKPEQKVSVIYLYFIILKENARQGPPIPLRPKMLATFQLIAV